MAKKRNNDEAARKRRALWLNGVSLYAIAMARRTVAAGWLQ